MKIREGDRFRKRFFELFRALIMTVIQGYFTGNTAFTQKIEGVPKEIESKGLIRISFSNFPCLSYRETVRPSEMMIPFSSTLNSILKDRFCINVFR